MTGRGRGGGRFGSGGRSQGSRGRGTRGGGGGGTAGRDMICACEANVPILVELRSFDEECLRTGKVKLRYCLSPTPPLTHIPCDEVRTTWWPCWGIRQYISRCSRLLLPTIQSWFVVAVVFSQYSGAATVGPFQFPHGTRAKTAVLVRTPVSEVPHVVLHGSSISYGVSAKRPLVHRNDLAR